MFALAQLRKLAITEQIYIVWPFYDCPWSAVQLERNTYLSLRTNSKFTS